MAVKVKGQPIETKPAAGLSTNAVIGYLIALVFAIWPNFAARVPDDLKLQLPVVIGTVLGAAVAYYTPHTNRPDLQSVTPFSADELARLRELVTQRQPGIPVVRS